MPLLLKSASPDGRFQVRTQAWEARNSLWVESPALFEAEHEHPLLQFSSEMWSLDAVEWRSNESVELTLRKYPGNHTPSHLVATIDCNEKTAALGTFRSVALSALEDLLDQQLSWV